MIFINIRGVPAAFWEETPFSGVSAIYRSDIVALVEELIVDDDTANEFKHLIPRMDGGVQQRGLPTVLLWTLTQRGHIEVSRATISLR